MSSNRSLFRNVQFYNAVDPDGDALGGFIQNGSVTEANFLHMLGIVLVMEAPICVQHRTSGHIVSLISSLLAIGKYDIYCDCPIQLNNGPWVNRVLTHNVSGRENSFQDGIRARDGRCVISGVINGRAPHLLSGFEAAHVFPLENENLWIKWSYGRWITDMGGTAGTPKINS
ncbi:hypothetical protein L873DRAFT_1590213, partial [Choiromyces venosus 120613-1]